MTRSRGLVFVALLALAFVAGGMAPARADNTDRIVQLLDRAVDALRDIARARAEPVRVTCDCRGGG